jgi:membrane-associated phospholipid phosphatase
MVPGRRELTLDELRELDAGWYFEDAEGAHPFRGQDIRIPTLREILETYPDTHLIVELKTDGGDGIIQPVIDLVREHGRDDGTVTVASFSSDYLVPVREQLPDVPTNMPEGETTGSTSASSSGSTPGGRRRASCSRCPSTTTAATSSPPASCVRPSGSASTSRCGPSTRSSRCTGSSTPGVHGIMTDYPDRLVQVLDERAAAGADRPGRLRRPARPRPRAAGRPGWLTTLMHVVTFIGDEEFYLLVFPILYWAISRRLGIRLGVMLLLTAGINGIGKLVPVSPRPAFLDPSLERVPEATFGIPSGHSQNAVAIWGLLAASLRRWWAVVAAVVLIVAIGVSRIYLGAHFLEDVLIGWTIGAVLLGLYLWLEAPVRRWLVRLRPADQVLAGFVASLALIAPAVLLSARLQGRRFDWPGLVHVEEAIGPSSVVTPAATLAGLAIGLVLLRQRGGFESDGPLGQRALRVLAGLVGVVVLWQGLGAVFPGGEDLVSLLLRYVRYALVGAWVGGIAPLLFVRFGLARAAEPTPYAADERVHG